MRILIVHRKLPYPANSGGTLRGAYLANSLARRHDVALVSFADRSAQEPEPEIVARFHAFETVPLPEMPRPLTRWLSREPGDVQQLVSGEMRRKISRIVDSLRPDVIVAGDPSLTWHVAPYRECARILDYICVATLQFERLRDLATGPQRILWEMRRRKYGAFHRRIAEHYDLCLLNSREDEDALRESAPMWGRVAVVPNGLDLNAYPTDLAPVERNMLVYPGSVTYPPNRDAVEFFIEQILPAVRREVPDVRFIVTGAEPNDGSAPRAPGVSYTGYLEDVRPAISRAWACVVPLRAGGGGARYKVLEAMALGTPIVATAVGAEGVDYTDGVNILMAEEPKVFARKTIEILQSAGLRAKISAASRRLMEELYDWDVLIARIVDHIEEVLQQKLASS